MRRILSFTLMLCMALTLPHEGYAKSKKKSNASQNQSQSENPKYASIIIDAASGTVLSERFANRPLHPASLTKVMTLMLLFEAMENGNVRLSDRILVSQNAAAQQPSKLGLKAGSSIRVEDALLSVVTKSANDMAVAIAEHLAGSESRFALRMTRRAHDIGMSGTTFRNASGLHNPSQVTTARDMAILARYIIIRYPNYYRYFGTKQFTYRGVTMTNHNRLMNTYPGMDGFKTGFINASGFNLIASAKRDGHRLIGVVFGGKSWKSRNDHMAELLNTNFENYDGLMIAKNQAVPVDKGTVPVIAMADPSPAKPAQLPPPAPKPVLKETPAAPPHTLQLPPSAADAPSRQNTFTSLSSLDTGRKMVVAPTARAAPEPDITEQAVASVQKALDRGDYSELTGEGDYDPGTTRRVQAGLLSAAVYKGEHDKVKRMQQLASATQAAQGVTAANPAQELVQKFAQEQQGAAQPLAPTPVALPPSAMPAPAASDLWSVQIGAYNSRVATDDALRLAASKLPSGLSHATPIVVPLKTAEGILFRARLGNFTRDQATSACRYFRDCLPVAPR